MKTFLFLGSCLLMAFSVRPLYAQTFSLGDFECQIGGATMTAMPDCEGWVSVAGTQIVVPDNVSVTGPCMLPTSGSRWVEVASQATGPAVPVVPPGLGGVWPFAPGSVSEMQISFNVPLYPSGVAALAVDWYFATDEGPSGGGFSANDFAQIVVINATTMSVVATLVYVDTYPPNSINSLNACFSAVTGFPPLNGMPNFQSSMVLLPPSVVGQPVIVSAICANQLDGQVSSSFWFDNFRVLDPNSGFGLLATTTGTCVGDLAYFIGPPPTPSTAVLVLVSATPATLGLGTGPAFGLVPDSVFFSTMFHPLFPFNILHYPITASPFASGAIVLPPGSGLGLCSQRWEITALAYNPAVGLIAQTNFAALNW